MSLVQATRSHLRTQLTLKAVVVMNRLPRITCVSTADVCIKLLYSLEIMPPVLLIRFSYKYGKGAYD